MRRQDPLAVFQVRLVPPLEPVYRDVDPKNLERVKGEAAKELGERFRAVKTLRVAIGTYQGAKVHRLDYQAETRVFGSRHAYREVRFHRGGAHYALVAYCPVDTERDAEPHLVAALESFSFLGPVEATDEAYVSFAEGFKLARPTPDWRLSARLLDPAKPVEVLAPGPAGRYAVHVGRAEPFRNPGDAADALEKSLARASRFFKRLGREDRTVGGLPAVFLRYQDFGEGGARLREYRRLFVVKGDRLFELGGSRLATEADAAGHERAIDALFAAFEPFEPETADLLYGRGRRALDLRVSGEKQLEGKSARTAVEHLTEAIDAYPHYGLAYLLRGKAYVELQDFRKALKDYDAADDLLDDPGVSRLVALAQNQHAASLQKEGDYEGALRLFEDAVRNDPGNKRYKEDHSRAILEQAKALGREGKFDEAIKRLRSAILAQPEEPRFKKELVKVHQDQAVKLRLDDDLYKARVVLKRALKLEPENTRTQQLLRQVEDAIKKKEEKKPGTKK
jgi:tetratricopeptide (TPR) repeat protein